MGKQFFFSRLVNHRQRRGVPVVTRHAFAPIPPAQASRHSRDRALAGLTGATLASTVIGLCHLAPVVRTWLGF